MVRVVPYSRSAAHPNQKADKKPVCALVFVLRALRHAFRDDFSRDCGRNADTASWSRRACPRNYFKLAWSRTFSSRLRLLRRSFRDGMVLSLISMKNEKLKIPIKNEEWKILK